MLDTRCCLLSVVQSTILLDGMCPEINTVLGLQARNFLCETKLLRLGIWVTTDVSGFLLYWCSVHIVGWTTYSLVPGGWTLILALETSEFQQRKTAEMDWNRVVWLECDSVSVIRVYMPLDCCMFPWNACGNKHRVVFLLAMKAVCCAWRDLLGSAFPGAEVSAPEPHKTSQPHTTHAAPTGFIAPVKQMLLE